MGGGHSILYTPRLIVARWLPKEENHTMCLHPQIVYPEVVDILRSDQAILIQAGTFAILAAVESGRCERQ